MCLLKYRYWEKGGRHYDYVSTFAFLALAYAHKAQYTLPPSVLTNAVSFLGSVYTKYSVDLSKEIKKRRKEEEQEQQQKSSLSARALRIARRYQVHWVGLSKR